MLALSLPTTTTTRKCAVGVCIVLERQREMRTYPLLRALAYPVNHNVLCRFDAAFDKEEIDYLRFN